MKVPVFIQPGSDIPRLLGMNVLPSLGVQFLRGNGVPLLPGDGVKKEDDDHDIPRNVESGVKKATHADELQVDLNERQPSQQADSCSRDHVGSVLSPELKVVESTLRLVKSNYLPNYHMRVLEAELQPPLPDGAV